jgi:adenylate cyclase
MPTEIERKFLVADATVVGGATGTRIRQGYLSTDVDRTVRVRRAGQRAFVTIKGRSQGAARAEFEYEIPPDEADQLLDRLCLRPLVEKTRFQVDHRGHIWEVDVFDAANVGLVIAEIELSREDEPFERPPWVGAEVTADARYYNANLVARPFTTWDRG